MTQRILIYLHTQQASWLILDENERIQQSMTRGNLADLIPLTENCKIEVIVPGQTILLTTAKLPKLNAQRLMQALPFTLEEQLIDDINTLHFAIGEYQSSGSFAVAVIAKEKMATWLAALAQANITADALVPATLALPCTPDNWYACIYDEIGIVRTGQDTGFSCDQQNLQTFFELQLSAAEQKPACIHLYNFSATPTTIQLNSTTLNEMTLSEDQFLEHLAKWTATYPFINLLQGSYTPTKKATATKKIWIAVSCLAIACIGFALVSNLGSWLILQHATATSEQLIHEIYQRNFPQASAVVAPRQRMAEKLKKLDMATSKNNFLSILSHIGNSLPKAKGIQLLSMDFHGNQLTLRVSAITFDSLDRFTQALTQQGLNVKQQSGGIAGSAVKANLLIELSR